VLPASRVCSEACVEIKSFLTDYYTFLKFYLSWFVDPDNISENKDINILRQEAQAVNQTKLISNLMLYIFRAITLRM